MGTYTPISCSSVRAPDLEDSSQVRPPVAATEGPGSGQIIPVGGVALRSTTSTPPKLPGPRSKVYIAFH